MAMVHAPGSVFEIEEGLSFVVIGYCLQEFMGKAALLYYLVPYPLGYLDQGSILTTPALGEYEVIHEGYTDPVVEKLVDNLGIIAEQARESDFEQIQEMFELFENNMQDPSVEVG